MLLAETHLGVLAEFAHVNANVQISTMQKVTFCCQYVTTRRKFCSFHIMKQPNFFPVHQRHFLQFDLQVFMAHFCGQLQLLELILGVFLLVTNKYFQSILNVEKNITFTF